MRGRTPAEVDRLAYLGGELRRRANEVLTEADFPAQVTGDGSLFRLVPGRARIVNYRSMDPDPNVRRLLEELHLRLLGAGIVVGSKGTGCLSTPMDRSELDRFVDSLERAVRDTAR
jgi:glutamate-1-semialdehyde 2,1-aminomutase